MPDTIINGLNHHWEEAGSGEVLLMLHGAASSSATFAADIGQLSKTCRVVAPDMRGMGQSARISSLVPPAAWVEDVGGLLDHLEIRNVHLFGVSLGARIALRFGINQPQRVRSMILDMPIIANESSGNQALNARMGNTDDLPPAAQQRYEAQHGSDWAEVVRNYFNIRNDPAVQEYLNLREMAKAVKIPTLITRGDNRADTVHPLPHVFELFNSIETSRLWIKPEGGCFATPEGYEVVARFISEAAKQPATA